MQDPVNSFMLGYTPKRVSLRQSKYYYYYPFFMNGKIFASSLFDSMISWTFEDVNHLSTIKKLASSDYL